MNIIRKVISWLVKGCGYKPSPPSGPPPMSIAKRRARLKHSLLGYCGGKITEEDVDYVIETGDHQGKSWREKKAFLARKAKENGN